MNQNPYDESDLNAFRDNESRIKTDDRELDELDEFDYQNLDLEVKRFNNGADET